MVGQNTLDKYARGVRACRLSTLLCSKVSCTFSRIFKRRRIFKVCEEWYAAVLGAILYSQKPILDCRDLVSSAQVCAWKQGCVFGHIGGVWAWNIGQILLKQRVLLLSSFRVYMGLWGMPVCMPAWSVHCDLQLTEM